MNALNNKDNISIKIVKIKLSLICNDINKDFVEIHFEKFFYNDSERKTLIFIMIESRNPSYSFTMHLDLCYNYFVNFK